MEPFVNIHTHRPTGRGIELRTAGVHPWEADLHAAERLAEVLGAKLGDQSGLSDGGCAPRAAAAGIQAIGEIGLDFACRSDRTLQTEVLRIQLRLASRLGLPVVLHCVRAFEPLMRELAACPPRAVIFHGFIGSPEQARQALAHGCCLSFGERVFASPKSLRALHEVPPDRLFLETDDAPVAIERIYDRAARELGLEVGVLRRAAYENYKRIFEPKHKNG